MRSRIRSVLVGASVVVIVLSTFKFTMTLLDGGTAVQPPAIENSGEPQPEPAADAPVKPAVQDQLTPSMTSPTPIGKQSLNTAPLSEAGASLTITHRDPPALGSRITSSDITGSLPPTLTQPLPKLGTVQLPPGESLPDAIGGTALRTAALEGDPRAAYEVAVRFAEGKGVASNFEEAAKWYERAAQAGVVPAIFRLGTLYEKGLGVKRDADLARRYYLEAAERGNAKAMHNLAVLEADGGGKGANYRSAADWFRRAADHGVADSQFNLAILYARGIGVEQNLAESFKWFSLAAAQGDADAARRRDEIGKKLDAQSLAAAKLAIQTFTAEPQPEEAVTVISPPGGWDAPPSAANPVKSAAKPALIKRASR
jgi:localization factor PodJL